MKRISFVCATMLLVACDMPEANITRSEAVELLTSGEVSKIGVSHSGWTYLTLRDGSYRQNRAAKIGSPNQLLDQCSDCSNVSSGSSEIVIPVI